MQATKSEGKLRGKKENMKLSVKGYKVSVRGINFEIY
jgi:hypothetical protein